MNEFKAGALLPAYLSKATIVPVALKKAYTLDISSDHTKQLEIEYGKPIRASEYKKISQEDLAKELHDWIQVELIFHQRINDRSIHPLFYDKSKRIIDS